MFEADNQLILDEYLSGLINERNFKAEAKLSETITTRTTNPLLSLPSKPIALHCHQHTAPLCFSGGTDRALKASTLLRLTPKDTWPHCPPPMTLNCGL
jgi:hypothetical protein